jgi:hypothetical protein
MISEVILSEKSYNMGPILISVRAAGILNAAQYPNKQFPCKWTGHGSMLNWQTCSLNLSP